MEDYRGNYCFGMEHSVDTLADQSCLYMLCLVLHLGIRVCDFHFLAVVTMQDFGFELQELGLRKRAYYYRIFEDSNRRTDEPHC